MKRVSITDLAPGMRLAEDLFFQRGGLGVPLFSRGVELTERNISQIRKFFSQVDSILVQELPGASAAEAGAGDEAAGAATGTATAETQDADGADAGDLADLETLEEEIEGSTITAASLASGSFERDEANELFRNTLYRRPEFEYTKAKFQEYFSQVSSLLSTFTSTSSLHESEVLDLGQRVTVEFMEAPEYLDPSLLYLVQLEHWDQGTFNHSFDVAVLTLLTASKMTDQFEELTSLFIAGLLHDIGKFIYSKYHLNDMDYIVKKPGGLTREEYEQIKRHVDIEEYVNDWFTQLPPRQREHIIYGILEHHERYNGTGYLKGKKGANISFAGRLIGVVDVYDALTRRRSYKTMIRPDAAMQLLTTMADRELFDRKLFSTFYRLMGRYPVGSVLSTSNGIAVVSRQNPRSVDRPFLIFSDDSQEINSLADPTIVINDVR